MVHGKQWSKQGVKSLDTYFQIRYFYIWMFTPGLPVFLLEFASYTPITTWSRISLILLLHQFLIFQSLIITFTPNANQCFFFFFLLYNTVLVLPYIYIPLLGIHTKETRIEKDTCTPMFIVALFIIARTWKQSVFLIKRPTCSAHREPHDCQCFPSVSYIQNGNKAIQYVTY